MPDGTQPTTPPTEAPKRESWLNNFFGKIGDQLEDLTYVSIITGTGNTYAKIEASADNIVEELEKNQITHTSKDKHRTRWGYNYGYAYKRWTRSFCQPGDHGHTQRKYCCSGCKLEQFYEHDNAD